MTKPNIDTVIANLRISGMRGLRHTILYALLPAAIGLWAAFKVSYAVERQEQRIQQKQHEIDRLKIRLHVCETPYR